MKGKTIIIVAAFTLLFMFSGAAFAQTGEMKAMPTSESACTLEQRINEKIGQFKGLQRNHVQTYNDLQDRIKKLNEKLGASELESDLKAFSNKTIKFAKDYGTFISRLSEARAVACANAEEAKSKIGKAAELLKVVYNDARDISEYYKTEIRKDVTSLKKS